MRVYLRRLLLVGLGVTVTYDLAVCAAVVWDRLTPAAGFALVLPPFLVGLVGLGALLLRMHRRTHQLLSTGPRLTRVERRTNDMARKFDDAVNDITTTVADIRATMGAHRMVFLDAFSRASWPTPRSAAADAGYRSIVGDRT